MSTFDKSDHFWVSEVGAKAYVIIRKKLSQTFFGSYFCTVVAGHPAYVFLKVTREEQWGTTGTTGASILGGVLTVAGGAY